MSFRIFIVVACISVLFASLVSGKDDNGNSDDPCESARRTVHEALQQSEPGLILNPKYHERPYREPTYIRGKSIEGKTAEDIKKMSCSEVIAFARKISEGKRISRAEKRRELTEREEQSTAWERFIDNVAHLFHKIEHIALETLPESSTRNIAMRIMNYSTLAIESVTHAVRAWRSTVTGYIHRLGEQIRRFLDASETHPKTQESLPPPQEREKPPVRKLR